MMRLFLCVLVFIATTSAQAQTKIAVLSDIHVMSPELLVNDGTAWQNFLNSDRKLLDYSHEVYDVLIEKFLADKPDILLITGDLTKDGEKLSHQYVVAGLDRLREAGIHVYVIPGNHDRGTENALIFDGDTKSKAEVASGVDFENVYQNYGYNSSSVRESTTLTYACEPVRGLVLIGIDSGNNGSLSAATLNWVCLQAEKARNEGKQVIAMMHHPLFPHVNNLDRFMGSYRVNDHENVRNRLIDAGVRVILTGHVHMSDIAKDYNTELKDYIYDVNTGSPISYPCDYRVMTLSKDMKQLSIRTGHITELPSNENFAKTAKARLQGFAQKYASNIISNEMFINILTSMITLHAEGSENRSSDSRSLISLYKMGSSILKSNASLTAKLKARGLTWEDAETTMYSMLEDKSSYGIEGHEDQTNDLRLDIEMPDLQNPITLRGDINRDGEINIVDVVILVNIILDKSLSYGYNMEEADLDGNGVINITDAISLLNIILG